MAEELLGRFRLGNEIARTDSARLYQARDEIAGEPASVVVFEPNVVRTLGDLKALQKRVQVLRAMDSPHILIPSAFGMQDGTWYVASAGSAGVPLDQVSTSLGALGAEDAFALGAQLFRALSHLHPRGIVPQQLGPTAVLVADDGALKVWPVYSTRHSSTAKKTLAMNRMDFASMIYSPTGGASRPNNVYSAGMLLAQLLVGGPPVQPKTLPELLSFVQKPQLNLAQPLDPELEAIVMSTLQPNAMRRPSARLAYGQILSAADLKARQLQKRTHKIVAFLTS